MKCLMQGRVALIEARQDSYKLRGSETPKEIYLLQSSSNCLSELLGLVVSPSWVVA
jgi:hypothetical protein